MTARHTDVSSEIEWPWEFYSRSEITCHCGCGDAEMNPGTMAKADLLRRMCGFPLPVNSGKRCAKHDRAVSKNKKPLLVNGIWTYRHDGHALDFHVWGQKAYTVIEKAPQVGFTGIGIHQNGPLGERFVHVDDLLEWERRWVWTY